MNYYKIAILVVSLLIIPSCGNSNSKYRDDIEKSFSSIMNVGTSKEKITTHLKNHGHKYSEHHENICGSERITRTETRCSNFLVIHTRVNINKLLNPVKSGAHIYFRFNESNLLESYKIDIRHGFL